MSKIAIVIGVSNYIDQPNLAACKNDAELVEFILKNTNDYEDILCLKDDDTKSEDVKHQLTQFVEKHRSRLDLDEVFFFYSGHGQFHDNEFYYVLSDFDNTRRNRTSLKNSELDGYLRTLKPKLAIKIVDACNAGVQYVKDSSGISTIIEKSTKEQGFDKVYFLFSSLFDQNSFASNEVSHYTKSFLEAIYSSKRPQIRYRDIVDHISDQFENNREQKPFFVIQADNTEMFGVFSDEFKNQIREKYELKINNPHKTITHDHSPVKQPSLSDIIKEQAKDYLSEIEIIESIDQILKAAQSYTLSAEIADLYEIKAESAKNFHGLSGLNEIGKWLNENQNEYFARVVTRVEEYEGFADDILGSYVKAFSLQGESRKKITKTRKVISGYEMQWDEPSFWRVELSLNSQFPNIPSFKLDIVYLFSRLDIRIFYSVSEELSGPKGLRTNVAHGEWKALQLRLRDLKENFSIINPIFVDLTNLVIERLRQIAGVPKDELT